MTGTKKLLFSEKSSGSSSINLSPYYFVSYNFYKIYAIGRDAYTKLIFNSQNYFSLKKFESRKFYKCSKCYESSSRVLKRVYLESSNQYPAGECRADYKRYPGDLAISVKVS